MDGEGRFVWEKGRQVVSFVGFMGRWDFRVFVCIVSLSPLFS